MECKGEWDTGTTRIADVLIETSWNVKYPHRIPFPVLTGINRNIVECKEERELYISLKSLSSINRNIVECKDRYEQRSDCGHNVLIETSWNVKLWNFFAGFVLRIVLIETSWNVKIGETKNLSFLLPVLIETSWNVKKRWYENFCWRSYVLIETSWNVKMHSWLLVLHGWSVLIETSWNVKEERPVLRQSLLHSINRNIVECKVCHLY